MTNPTQNTTTAIAEAFVAARRSGRALPGYPGDVPERMELSYAIQDAALALWDRPVAGWKIGRLPPEKQSLHGTERLTGPIFAANIREADGVMGVPVFDGGFAAVEAEYVFRLGSDADPAKIDYSEEEAFELIDAMFAGIEMAGSPLKTINVLGPTVVASDFGNNFGLILGRQLAQFGPDTSPSALDAESVKAFVARTEIDGQVVGEGGLFKMPGGPLKAIAWLAGHLASRGRPLQAGQLISSGASTGIHDIGPNQSARVIFVHEEGDIELDLSTKVLTKDHAVLA